MNNHVSEVIHATPRDFGVLVSEFVRYTRRCFTGYLQRVEDCPLKNFVGFEFFERHAIEVIRYKVNGVEDVSEPEPPYPIRHTPTRREWRRVVPG